MRMNTQYSPSITSRPTTSPGPVVGMVLYLAMFLTLPGGLKISRAAGVAPDAAAIPATSVGPIVSSVFPAAGAPDVCPDTPLRLTFATPPMLGTNGKIQICNAADNAVVETIDVSSPTSTKTIGGLPNYRYYPVIISGRQATIYPRNGALVYGQTYSVTIQPGVFRRGPEADADRSPPTTWRFTIKAAAPAVGTTRLVVAADGTGDFCTVQGALDFIPEGNTTPTTIFLRKGTYTELVFFTDKHAITLVGEDRQLSVIAYANNDRFNPSSGNPFASSNPNPSAAPRTGGNIYHRGVFLAHHVNDLTLANLTIRNTTPQGGSQAEAIILNGTTTARAILKDVDLYSYQDTLQINGQAYLDHCYIEGDVDFMWGTGPCFFENCLARSLRSDAYYTQIRNPGTNHGYVYLHCTFDGLPGIMGNYLSRIGTGRFPHSEVVLLDCVLDNAVDPVGWQFSGGREGDEHDPAEVHFWEFNSRRPDSQPVDPRLRLAGSRQLQSREDAALIANYRNPAFVLGSAWNPRLAPIFTNPPSLPPPATPAAGAPVIAVQPAGQMALLGTSPYFTVVATGVGPLHYQWAKNGTALPGANSPVLRLEGMKWEDAGIYAVTVINSAGSVMSAAARLTAVAPAATPAPQLPAIPAVVFDVTARGAVGDGATDSTTAIQQTIDAALAAGGGIVVVPAAPKPYLSGPLVLGSKINLQVDAGATLQALPYSPEATPPAGFYPFDGPSYVHWITATNARDVALTGGGTIDGRGEAWWAAFRANKAMPHRPYMVRFSNCERVLVSGLTFTNSPMFHVAMTAVHHLTLFGLTITSEEGPNTDGLDPSGEHQLIQNCIVSCGDDNIAVKAGDAFCADLTVADCAFGIGHGLSVGGQSNRDLDGMTVKNCLFDGTTSGLRLKADPTQGGAVKNVTYSNLVMRNVKYPIVFYSYYNKVGNPGSISGGNATTPERMKAWNATPPNPLGTKTLPSWKNIAITNVTATGVTGFNIIWGLPLEGCFMDNVRLNHVRLLDGPGLKAIDATDVQFAGDTTVGNLVTYNALVLTRQPQSQTMAPGRNVTFDVGVAGASGTRGTAPICQWSLNDVPLADGKRDDGMVVSGAAGFTLKLDNVQPAAAGKYTATVTAALDAYDVAAKSLAPDKVSTSATSTPATLTISAPREDPRSRDPAESTGLSAGR
jgi:pectin methylesterase-like acyl-CoA thioesterase